ncbi:MAG TPA: hypothetical protein VLK36_07245 [Gaiellaceae bacterium]|nr:hypothetical protein [Gaiellaceae bacterium]
MRGARSPELLAIPMVVVAVVYAGLLYWALTAETALSWIVFVLANVAIAVLVFALLLRRGRPRFPSGSQRPRAPKDGTYRLLVLADGGSAAAAIREQLAREAAGRHAEAFVIAPALSSRLDWLTGDQAVYDRAAAELESTLAALEAVGIDAHGRVGAADPVQAAADGLREYPAEAIVVVTEPGATPAWLAEGVLETLQARADIPVSHVVA